MDVGVHWEVGVPRGGGRGGAVCVIAAIHYRIRVVGVGEEGGASLEERTAFWWLFNADGVSAGAWC